MPDQMPQDPVSEMTAAAIGMHELMMSYVAAGFTPQQAFSVVLVVIQSSIAVYGAQGGPGAEGP